MKREVRPKLPLGAGASDDARRAAVAVLSVMAGELSTSEAAKRLSLSVNRYYQLEARALQAMVSALEPLPRGRRRGRDFELEKLRKARSRAEREATRFQALLRVAQRALALSAPPPRPPARVEGPKGKAAGKRARRPRVRARTVIAAMSESVATILSPPAATEVIAKAAQGATS